MSLCLFKVPSRRSEGFLPGNGADGTQIGRQIGDALGQFQRANGPLPITLRRSGPRTNARRTLCLGVALQFLPYRISEGGLGRAGWLASTLCNERVHHEHG